jgi:hypothetical protein
LSDCDSVTKNGQGIGCIKEVEEVFWRRQLPYQPQLLCLLPTTLDPKRKWSELNPILLFNSIENPRCYCSGKSSNTV